jgi:hypothetical protein
MISPAHRDQLREVRRSVSVRPVASNQRHTPAWVVVVTHTAQERSGQVIFVRRFESLPLALGFAAKQLVKR